MLPRVIRAAVLLSALLTATLAGCRGVSPAQMASMPAAKYHIEYYMITTR